MADADATPLRVGIVGHFSKGESTRTTGFPIRDHVDFLDGATPLGEGGVQRVFGRIPGEVSNVESGTHSSVSFRSVSEQPNIERARSRDHSFMAVCDEAPS